MNNLAISLLRQGERLIMNDVQGQTYLSERAAFVGQLVDALDELDWATFARLPLQPVIDWGLAHDTMDFARGSPEASVGMAEPETLSKDDASLLFRSANLSRSRLRRSSGTSGRMWRAL